jgi:hypothetical protein
MAIAGGCPAQVYNFVTNFTFSGSKWRELYSIFLPHDGQPPPSPWIISFGDLSSVDS